MVEGGFEDVGSLLVADDEAAETGEPGEGSLDHPAVPAEALAGVEAASGDAWDDVAIVAGLAAAREIVGLVGVQLARSPAGPTPALADRCHRIEHRLQHPALVDVGRGQGNGEGNAAGIDEKVALAARPAAIGRVRAGESRPPCCRDTRRIERTPPPVDRVGPTEPIEQDAMQPRPDPRLLPVAHAAPAGHARAAAHLPGQHLPRQGRT